MMMNYGTWFIFRTGAGAWARATPAHAIATAASAMRTFLDAMIKPPYLRREEFNDASTDSHLQAYLLT